MILAPLFVLLTVYQYDFLQTKITVPISKHLKLEQNAKKEFNSNLCKFYLTLPGFKQNLR